MALNTQRLAIRDFESQLAIKGKWLDVVSVEFTTVLAALHACEIISCENSSTPSLVSLATTEPLVFCGDAFVLSAHLALSGAIASSGYSMPANHIDPVAILASLFNLTA